MTTARPSSFMPAPSRARPGRRSRLRRLQPRHPGVGEADLRLGDASGAEVAVRGCDRALAAGEDSVPPPKQAPQVASRPSRRPRRRRRGDPRRSAAGTRLRGRYDDHPAARVDGPDAQDLRRLAEVGDRPVRAVPHYTWSIVSRGLVDGTMLPGECGSATSGGSESGRFWRRCASSASGSDRSACHGLPVGVRRGRRHAFVGGKEPGFGARSTAMFATASRSSIVRASAPGPNELEHHVRCPADPDLGDHSETGPCRDERPLLAAELDLDRARTACQNSPSPGRRAMSSSRAGSEGASAPDVQVCESPPAITEPGTTQPSSTSTVCSIPPLPGRSRRRLAAPTPPAASGALPTGPSFAG